MSSSDLQDGVERHSTLYFEDGDIVLAARITKERTMVFRVDKIFLSRHSPIFRDMLSFKPGDSSADRYDGVPRVDMPDDAKALAYLLMGMYNAASLPLKPFDAKVPRRMTGTMRLAIKYEVDSVSQLIMRHVAADWPKTLREYEVWRLQRKQVMEQDNGDGSEPLQYEPEPVAAICFADEFECPEILPAALYRLAAIPTTDNDPRPLARWDLLDCQTYFRLTALREKLILRLVDEEKILSEWELSDECHQRDRLWQDIQRCMKPRERNSLHILGRVLSALRILKDGSTDKTTLAVEMDKLVKRVWADCESCAKLTAPLAWKDSDT